MQLAVCIPSREKSSRKKAVNKLTVVTVNAAVMRMGSGASSKVKLSATIAMIVVFSTRTPKMMTKGSWESGIFKISYQNLISSLLLMAISLKWRHLIFTLRLYT